MVWYSTGTVSVPNNGATATGAGTQWLASVRSGDGIAIAGSTQLHQVINVVSDTQLTFMPAYAGTTGSSKQYSIVPVQGYVRDLADQVKQLLTNLDGTINWADINDVPAQITEIILSDGVNWSSINDVPAQIAEIISNDGVSWGSVKDRPQRIDDIADSAVLDWASYGGTANAFTLTSDAPRTAYRTGDQIRFRATAANTGATTVNMDGMGVKSVVTATGVALPAGYIRTGVDTLITYDGARWVAGRESEIVESASGRAVRYANGELIVEVFEANPTATQTPLGALFVSSGKAFAYPAVFFEPPSVCDASSYTGKAGGTFGGASWSIWDIGPSPLVSCTGFAISTKSTGGSYMGFVARGIWYR